MMAGFHPSEMTDGSVMELRVELYSDGPLPATTVEQISRLLAERWPEAWDVKVPPKPSLDHPAEWRSVVPLPDGVAPEVMHLRIEEGISALDPARAFHYRTRWALQESPNHQEIYEVRWTPKKR
jgi:hypothetical protein